MSFYARIVKTVKRHLFLYRAVALTATFLPWFFVAVYFIAALILLFTLNLKIIFFLAVPLLSFIACTLLRNYLDFQRPFEVYGFDPIIEHKNGKSFPSRHTTMAASIAFAILFLNRPFGIIMLILALFVSISRILSGVHFIRDCVAGWVIGGVLSMIGFFFIAQIFGM